MGSHPREKNSELSKDGNSIVNSHAQSYEEKKPLSPRTETLDDFPLGHSHTKQTDSGNDVPLAEAEGESRRSTAVHEKFVDGNQRQTVFPTQETAQPPANTTPSAILSDSTSTHNSQVDGLDFNTNVASPALAFHTQAVLHQRAAALPSSAGMNLGYFPCVTPQSVVMMQPQPISNALPLQLQGGYEATLRQLCVGSGTPRTTMPMMTGGGISIDNNNFAAAALAQNHTITIHSNPTTMLHQPTSHPTTMFSSQNHLNMNVNVPSVVTTGTGAAVPMNVPDANPSAHNHHIPANASAPEIHLNANIVTTQQPQQQPVIVPVAPTSTVAPIPLPIQQQQQPPLTVQESPNPPVYNGVNPSYPGLQVIHQNPPIFAVSNFLTSTECDFLTCVAQDCFTPAPVVGKGAGEVTSSRTSSTCYLAREDLPEYLRKVSLLTGKPVDHCELPQVGRYFPSQQYLQHFDAFDLSNEDGRRFAQNGGQRTVTVLVYLNDVQRGGQTAFPALNLEVQPKKGMALVFFPATVDGLLDKNALHAAKPAIDTKYVSQVWIRQSNYQGLPSKRMFSSAEQASIVQKSLICAREGNNIDFSSIIGGGGVNNANGTCNDALPPARQ